MTVPYEDNRGRKWKFCSHCKCRATERVGIYQLSHFDNDHRGPDPGPPAVAPGSAPAPRSADPAPAVAPQSNLTQVLDPHPLPPGPPAFSGTMYDLDDFAALDDDPDAIEFQGMWCAAVFSTDAPDVSIVTLPVERENGFVPTDKIDDDNDTWFDCDEDDAAEIGDDNDTWFDCSEDDAAGDCFFDVDDAGMNDLDHSPHSFPATFYPDWVYAPVRWLLFRLITLPLFWVTGLLWDTLFYFVSSPIMRSHHLPRRCRRHSRRSPFLRGYPVSWLILSNAVVIASMAYSGHVPRIQFPTPSHVGMHLNIQMRASIERVRRLDHLVDLSAANFLRFNQYKFCVFTELIPHTSFYQAWTTNEISEAINQEVFFDCYSHLPQEHGDYFFDAEQDDQTQPLSPDWFDLGSLDSPAMQVDCRYPINQRHSIEAISDAAQACVTQTSTTEDIFSFGTVRHPVIFDSGASLGITFDKNDFDGPLSKPEGDLRLGGMASGLLIEGIGSVTYTFRNGNGTEVQIRSNCYYVPGAQVRLISPQRLFNSARGVGGQFVGTEHEFKLIFDNGTELTVEYDERNHLPIGYARVGMEHPVPDVNPQANVLLLDEANQNLTHGQKLLLQWHYRFGHLNLRRIQALLRVFPFTAAKYASASKCDIASMKCSICQYAKAHRRSTHSTTSKLNADRDGSLKATNLSPGNRVSVDHFESRLLGRTYDSYGKPSSNQYKGG